ncbi:MAG TPA: Hsp20/alpha crystallin family protein [Thermoanaerobaculia bacterium]
MSVLTRFDQWDPFEELAALRTRMDRILARTAEGTLTTAWTPAVDVFETEDAIFLKAELPGLEQKDINVEIQENILTVEGERKLEDKVEEKGYQRIERSYGKFLRSFTLPPNVDPTKIMASFNNGVLDLRVPKKEEAKPKKITVQVKEQLTKKPEPILVGSKT